MYDLTSLNYLNLLNSYTPILFNFFVSFRLFLPRLRGNAANMQRLRQHKRRRHSGDPRAASVFPQSRRYNQPSGREMRTREWNDVINSIEE